MARPPAQVAWGVASRFFQSFLILCGPLPAFQTGGGRLNPQRRDENLPGADLSWRMLNLPQRVRS